MAAVGGYLAPDRAGLGGGEAAQLAAALSGYRTAFVVAGGLFVLALVVTLGLVRPTEAAEAPG